MVIHCLEFYFVERIPPIRVHEIATSIHTSNKPAITHILQAQPSKY